MTEGEGYARQRQGPPLMVGVVTSTDDPEDLGRVQFRVGGFIAPPSPWAWPLGGGGRNRGLFATPRVGAYIALWWAVGDLDGKVFFLPANWRLTPQDDPDFATVPSEVPVEAREAEDPAEVVVLSTETFGVELNESAGSRRARMRCRATDSAPEMAIEIDAETNTITVTGHTAINLQCLGQINIDAPIVSINGRVIKSGEGDI